MADGKYSIAQYCLTGSQSGGCGGHLMTICSLFMFRELILDDLSFAVVAKQLKKVDPMHRPVS